MLIASEIQAQVKSLGIPHSQSSVSPYVTVSVGVATAACLPGMGADQWIGHADEQLYLSKSGGRNRICGVDFSDEMAADAQQLSAGALR